MDVMEQNEALLDLILNENPIGAAGTSGEGKAREETEIKKKKRQQKNETEMVTEIVPQRCKQRGLVNDLI